MRAPMSVVKSATLMPDAMHELEDRVPDWPALAQAINDRMQETGMTQRELAERSGVSVATLRRIQSAFPQRRSPVTLAAISRALSWPDDHLRDVLRGGTGQATADSPADRYESKLDAIAAEVTDLANRVRRLESANELKQ